MHKEPLLNIVAVDLDGENVNLPRHQPPMILTKDFKGIWEIERHNQEKGFYFFNHSTMTFFKSKIGRYLGNGVFLTQETDFRHQTAWSIRVASETGDIQTFGDFHTFKHGKTANAAGKRLSKLLGEGKTVADFKGKLFQLSK